MTLYLVRHGEAAPVGGAMTLDADRPLTQRGERDMAALGQVIAHLDRRVAHVLTSPLARARQSGAILASALGNGVVTRTTENLSPGFRPKGLLAELAKIAPEDSVIAVGHQPDLGEFLSSLVTDASHAAVAFPPGGAAGIILQAPPQERKAVLQWLLTPDAVHRITTL